MVIHTPALEVLLLERADRPGFWQSVTGSQHEGEALRDTAIREVARGNRPRRRAATRSRTWNLQNVYEIYPVWRHRYAPGVTHNTEHVFGLRVPGARAGHASRRASTSRREWLPWREAAERVFSWSNRNAILMLPERARSLTMTRKKTLNVVTYNIHKGLSQFNQRLVLHGIRDGLKGLEADVAFLQEVQGKHDTNARRHVSWPEIGAARVPHPRGLRTASTA